MTHAIPYLIIAALCMASALGLDKSVAEPLKAATYLLMGLGLLAAHLPAARVGRWAAMLFLVIAFQTVEIGCAACGENRPPIVVSAGVSARPERVG